MSAVIEWLSKNWDVLTSAPWVFATSVAISLGIGYVVGTWFKNGEIAILERRIAEYEKKVGSSPDEAKSKIDRLQGELARAPPSLGLSMEGGNIFSPDAPDVKGKLIGLGLDVRVWNTGGPTYVTKWSLLIIAPGHIPVVAQLTSIPEMLRVGGPLNSAVMRSSEDLSVKTSMQQVELAPMSGKLLFYVPEIDRKSFENATTRLQLTATDSYGTEKRVEQLIGEWMKR